MGKALDRAAKVLLRDDPLNSTPVVGLWYKDGHLGTRHQNGLGVPDLLWAGRRVNIYDCMDTLVRYRFARTSMILQLDCPRDVGIRTAIGLARKFGAEYVGIISHKYIRQIAPPMVPPERSLEEKMATLFRGLMGGMSPHQQLKTLYLAQVDLLKRQRSTSSELDVVREGNKWLDKISNIT